MKKVILVIALGILLLASCGKDIPQEKTVKVNNVSISGKAKKYIKVVDGSYTFKRVEEDKVVIPIKLKLIQKVDLKSHKMGNLTLVPLDKSGIAISLGSYNHFSPATMSDWGKLEDLLGGELGEVSAISFECGGIFLNEEHIEKIMTETESFELTRTEITSDSSDETASYSNNETENSSNKDNNWDKLLNNYDNYVTEYVKLYKKAMEGDASALQDYPNLMAKAEELQNSLVEAQNSNSLNSSQLKRMMKIQNKMLNAMR